MSRERQRIVDEITEAVRQYAEERDWQKLRAHEIADIALRVLERKADSAYEVILTCTCNNDGYSRHEVGCELAR